MRRRKPSVEKLSAIVGFRPATTLRETIRQTAEALP
jgi:nucleoside-diphosphate-sugar epimerase